MTIVLSQIVERQKGQAIAEAVIACFALSLFWVFILLVANLLDINYSILSAQYYIENEVADYSVADLGSKDWSTELSDRFFMHPAGGIAAKRTDISTSEKYYVANPNWRNVAGDYLLSQYVNADGALQTEVSTGISDASYDSINCENIVGNCSNRYSNILALGVVPFVDELRRHNVYYEVNVEGANAGMDAFHLNGAENHRIERNIVAYSLREDLGIPEDPEEFSDKTISDLSVLTTLESWVQGIVGVDDFFARLGLSFIIDTSIQPFVELTDARELSESVGLLGEMFIFLSDLHQFLPGESYETSP